MKNAFYLEQNAENIGIIRINDTFKVCIRDLDSDITYFVGEKEDSEVSKDLLSYGCISFAEFINKQLERDVRILNQLESDNLFADAKINLTILMISGKTLMQSKFVLREELISFEYLLNKHEKYLLATKNESTLLHEEALNDAFNASPVSY